jgi:P-type Ca2+ transporter type 2C
MIAKWGGGIALLLFIILVIMFIIRLPGSNMSPSMKGEHLMQILIVSVSIVVVAVPEGLPLAVTLSLAYATIRMIEDNNLVRVLKACETVGNATTICSDKTGTLTENKMTVIAGTLGMADKFVRDAEESSTLGSRPPVEQRVCAITMDNFFPKLPKQLTTLLRDSIALNSTAFEGIDDERNKVFIGSKTETALLEMAKRHLDMDDVTTERRNAKSREIQLFPFSSERKCMGIIMEIEVAGRTVQRLYVKGASELILEHSDQIIDPSTSDPENLTVCTLSPEDRRVVSGTIEDYASHSLRTIALAFRDFSTPPSESYAGASETEAKFEFVFREMVFIGVVGIKDPLRPGVTKAVDDCRKAGVMVRMVTGDNISTAKAVATECGIYTDGIVMEGLAFRKLTRSQMYSIIPRLQVLARASPEDKRILVKRLKHLRQVVAVTGDGTNDAPALHAADVGFSMGIAGTEVAKAASSIILMDDNFASIVRAIAWGRCVNDAVKKFIQVCSQNTDG